MPKKNATKRAAKTPTIATFFKPQNSLLHVVFSVVEGKSAKDVAMQVPLHEFSEREIIAAFRKLERGRTQLTRPAKPESPAPNN